MSTQLPPRPLTDDLRISIEYAQREAERRHGNYIDVEHLLLGLLRHHAGPAHTLLTEHGADSGVLYRQIAEAVGMERPEPAKVRAYSRSAKAVLDRAAQEATALGQVPLNSGHLLLGLMAETGGAVHEVLSGVPLAADEVREYLRTHLVEPAAVSARPAGSMPRSAARPAARPAMRSAARSRPAAGSGDKEEVILIPFRPARKSKQPSLLNRWGNRPWIILGLLALAAYVIFVLPGNSLFTFVVVLIGWIISVSLHEFAHALVAYWGGDYTVKDKGYLSLNPLKYTHPMLSIGMPLLFLALGGIGLPGGAVYIERHRLKNKWWGAAVSAAGPAASLIIALLLAAPFALGLVDIVEALEHQTVWGAVAFLAMLQITAVMFNLLPIPPLDGFGIIEPLLDPRTVFQLRQISGYAFLLILLILWTPLGDVFWDGVFDVCRDLQIPGWLIVTGWDNFMFWRAAPQ